MWDLKTLQLTTIECSQQQLSKEDGDNDCIFESDSSLPKTPLTTATIGDAQLPAHVIQINDIKALDGSSEQSVALSNGYVLVYHGESGQLLNAFQNHTIAISKIIPLVPNMSPLTESIMQNYLQQQQKNPGFLTIGSGTFDTVDFSFQKEKTSTIDQRKSLNTPQEAENPLLVKLWNLYGDVVEQQSAVTLPHSNETDKNTK